MHYDEPHALPKTLADFLKQYAMIVVSILTALGFEQALVTWHNKNMAEGSRFRIEQELARDATDLTQCIARNGSSLAYYRGVYHTLAAAVAAGKADSAAIMPLTKSMQDHSDVCINSWQRDAWDAAIADQSAGNLSPPDLRRYAEIYAEARDAQGAVQLVLGGEWPMEFSEINWGINTGKLDATRLGIFVGRLLVALGNITAAEKDLLTTINKPATTQHP